MLVTVAAVDCAVVGSGRRTAMMARPYVLPKPDDWYAFMARSVGGCFQTKKQLLISDSGASKSPKRIDFVQVRGSIQARDLKAFLMESAPK